LEEGHKTMTLERDDTTLVVKEVPGLVRRYTPGDEEIERAA
jgi:hypothetical protein